MIQPESSHEITIVVPIYNAYSTTENCLEKLLKENTENHVILINDGSTDPKISTLLNQIEKSNSPNWQIHTNSHNLGFVKTANYGLKATPGHTILLNADTLVTTGWFDRFIEVIDAIADLATATPWSNNAEICSLPQTLVNNPLPDNPDNLAIQLKDRHLPIYPEIPTAVGFCMLITAEAKQRIGYFNETVFGHGYGEENDYSLRAAMAGMCNVVVDNAYVAHIGNQSFKEKALRPNQQTMNRLLALHPDYANQIDNFIKKDPLAPIRKSITDKIDAF